LRSKGVEFLNEPHDQEAWYFRVVHLKDPGGNVIEINHSIATP
jgi:lactoylglutathione lyase